MSALLSLGLERVLFHFAIVPMIGVAGSWLVGWHWLVFFGIDAVLSVAYEVARVGPLGVSIGIKDVIPVLIYFRVGFPRPTLAAAIVSGLVVAALIVGSVWFIRRWARLRPAYSGADWRRPGLSLAAGTAALMVGLFAAGVALMVPAAGPVLALPAVPLGWLAYALQTPPRRGGTWIRVVLARIQVKTSQTAPVGGVS